MILGPSHNEPFGDASSGLSDLETSTDRVIALRCAAGYAGIEALLRS